MRIPKAAVVVAAQLRRGIVRGEFKPGDALPNETELMHIYDVSRPVVREALRIIESESLISVKRGAGGGARVRAPTSASPPGTRRCSSRSRERPSATCSRPARTLEPDAVRRLAERRPPEAIGRLRESHEEGLRLVHDPTAYALHAARFHEELIELAGNKTLGVLGRLLQHIVEIHNRAAMESDAHPDEVAIGASEVHGRLIDLIEAGDVDGAVAHWRTHLEEAAADALERLGPTTIVDLLDEVSPGNAVAVVSGGHEARPAAARPASRSPIGADARTRRQPLTCRSKPQATTTRWSVVRMTRVDGTMKFSSSATSGAAASDANHVPRSAASGSERS